MLASHLPARRRFAAAIAPAVLFASAWPVSSATAQEADGQEITVSHAQGETVLEGIPETVLTFDVASLDTLHTLGVEVDGVPTATFPPYLSQYASDDYIRIGSLFEPDYEAVNAAAPDLIIVGGRSSEKYGDLAGMAPTVDMTIDATNFIPDVRERAETLGRIFGKEDVAADRLNDLEESIASLREQTADAGTGLLVMTNGSNISAYGPGSRFGYLYEEFGVTPAVDDIAIAGHGQAVSFEFILETNPDWLFVLDREAAIGRDGQAAREVLDNELVAQTTAWTEDQVVYLDSTSWYLIGGGLTATQAMVDQLADAMDRD